MTPIEQAKADGWGVETETDDYAILSKDGEQRVFLKGVSFHSEATYHSDGTKEYRIVKVKE